MDVVEHSGSHYRWKWAGHGQVRRQHCHIRDIVRDRGACREHYANGSGRTDSYAYAYTNAYADTYTNAYADTYAYAYADTDTNAYADTDTNAFRSGDHDELPARGEGAQSLPGDAGGNWGDAAV